jgi:single-strand DNA-binding protein
VEGRLTWRSWEAEDGTKRSKHEVVAQNVQFIGARAPVAEEIPEQEPSADPIDQDEDIPF